MTEKEVLLQQMQRLCSMKNADALLEILDSEEIKYISLHKATNNKFGYNISKGGQYAHMSHLEIEQHIKSKIKYDRCTVPGCDRNRWLTDIAKNTIIKYISMGIFLIAR